MDDKDPSLSFFNCDHLAIPPKVFDVNITDIDENELILIGIQKDKHHLSNGSFSSSPFPVVDGIIYGSNVRFIICLPVQRANNPSAPCLNVYFLLDTNCPHTYVTQKTMDALYSASNNNIDQIPLAIIDKDSRIQCYLSRKNFNNVNILGSSAMQQLNFSIINNWKSSSFQLARLF